MKEQFSAIDILLGNPVPINENVNFYVPTVEEVAYDEKFTLYTQLFTLRMRAIFSGSRDVDTLEKKFPTVWKTIFLKEEQGDEQLGQWLGYPVPASKILIDSLAYWSKLEAKDFEVLWASKKIVHVKTNWVIDFHEFKRIASLVKLITSYKEDDSLIAPKNMTNARFSAWINLYKGRLRALSKKKQTLADRILLLSISMDSYIPIHEIKKMSYYQFLKLQTLIQEKEAYEKRWQVRISPKFEGDNKPLKHWRETL